MRVFTLKFSDVNVFFVFGFAVNYETVNLFAVVLLLIKMLH